MRQAASAVRHYHNPAEQPRRESQCDRILRFIEESGRARTLKEIAVGTGIVDSTVSARLNALEKRGILTTLPIERKCEINGIVKQCWFFCPSPDPQRHLFGGGR